MRTVLQIFSSDMPRRLIEVQQKEGEKDNVDAALMASICRTVDCLDVQGLLFPSDQKKRQAIGHVSQENFAAAFNSCTLGLAFVFKVDIYVASAETVEAATTGLLNLTSQPDMAEAVSEIVGQLAGPEGSQSMIEGKIYIGGWTGLLQEAVRNHDETTAAGQALQKLMHRFNVN